MNKVRTIVGLAALGAALVGLNMLVLQENLFAPLALYPLGLSLVLGVVWLGLFLKGAASSGRASATGVSAFNIVFSSVVFLGICMVLYAFSLRWTKTVDLTKEGRRELSPQTIQVLENLTEDVNVYGVFATSGDDLTYDVMDKTRRFLDRCKTYTPRLNVEFFDPQVHKDRLESMGILRVYGVGTVVLKCGKNMKEIPLSDVTSRLEERDFTNALINVVRNTKPKVYFLTGHGERDVTSKDTVLGGSDFIQWLLKESYDVGRFAIQVANPTIPPDCSVLVIEGYTNDFHPAEIQAIDAYLMSGGRLFVMVDPQVLDPSLTQGPEPPQVVEHFRPWLEERLGIRVNYDVILSEVQTQYTQDPRELMLMPDYSILGNYDYSPDPNDPMRRAFNMEHPVTRGFDQNMVLSAARSVELSDRKPDTVSGATLLWSAPVAYGETDVYKLYKDHTAVKSPDEQEGPISLAVAVTMKTDVPIGDEGQTKDARVVVVGDSDFVSNDKIDYAGNHNFALNAMAWLTESEDLIAIRPTGEEDPPIILTKGQQQAIAWISALGVVQLVAGAGAVMYFWRRRYQ